MRGAVQDAVAIIPARGGSKGVPRKNLQRVGGEPLVARTVRTAKACPSIARVVVSTDDAEIAAVAESAGAVIILRPDDLASDSASSEAALLHALAVMRDRDGLEPDLVAFLQCTSPFLAVEDVEGTLDALRREGADSALAVCASDTLLWTRDEHGAVTSVNHDSRIRLRRQERPKVFAEVGSVYAFRTAGFYRARHRFFGRIAVHEVPRGVRCVEIDEPGDLELADWFARRDAVSDVALVPRPLGGVVFDFDGVFTDNAVWTGEDGRETVRSNRADGLGLERLRRAGVPVIVVSKERNPVVAARCVKLGLEFLQGVDEKIAVVRSWARDRGCDPSAIVYVGNDVNDVECLESVGLGVAVADAWPQARRAARLVLTRPGGDGAVREVCDLLLRALEARS